MQNRMRCYNAGVAAHAPGGRFTEHVKKDILGLLRSFRTRLSPALRADSMLIIPSARIPLLKIQLSCGLQVDLSINDNG